MLVPSLFSFNKQVVNSRSAERRSNALPSTCLNFGLISWLKSDSKSSWEFFKNGTVVDWTWPVVLRIKSKWSRSGSELKIKPNCGRVKKLSLYFFSECDSSHESIFKVGLHSDHEIFLGWRAACHCCGRLNMDWKGRESFRGWPIPKTEKFPFWAFDNFSIYAVFCSNKQNI